ncbi:MAG: calcium/sodium antiporter [Bacteroidales bacterium]|nr:calcium/sodium antiporter [Bacteroidales bacterium]MBR1783576.1 calcium/sodium antiporter [Bacteroidales bacterium]
MIVQILLLLVGLALVVFGADYLVEGASSIARRFGLSEFVIGLTIVGMGTSAPEMVVSFIGAFEGNADISVGNVIGSNIFNTMLILGLTALLLPMAVTPENRRKDIPMNILIVVLLIVLGFKNTLFGLGTDGLSRVDGAILLAVFILYMWQAFSSGKPEEQKADEAPQMKLWLAALMILGGLAALVFGGKLFVDSAVGIAHALNVSDKFIAITILAGGTSMPELATCVAAAVKKKGQLALGNIIGSNIFNILLILGGSALIHPLSFAGISLIDLGVLLLSTLVLLTACFVGKKNVLDRMDGVLFLLIWAVYMAWLIVNL